MLVAYRAIEAPRFDPSSSLSRKFTSSSIFSKTSHIRSVSSLAILTTVLVNGFTAMFRIRPSCPTNSAVLSIVLKSQSQSFALGHPCALRSCCESSLNSSAVTQLFVSIFLYHRLLLTFHKRIDQSCLPAPVTKVFFYQGHQASPFTAALWSVKVERGLEFIPQIQTVASSDPDAKRIPS